MKGKIYENLDVLISRQKNEFFFVLMSFSRAGSLFQREQVINDRNLDICKNYLDEKYDNRAANSKSMHGMEIIPDNIIFLIGHPCGGHKQEEKPIKNTQSNNKIEQLSLTKTNYNSHGHMILPTH